MLRCCLPVRGSTEPSTVDVPESGVATCFWKFESLFSDGKSDPTVCVAARLGKSDPTVLDATATERGGNAITGLEDILNENSSSQGQIWL